ncbi:MAG: adenosylcobinamide-GDP ribazoletransferase [Sneathiella sp.]|nr:adenosylcobinamide-GDP ribazoletransferase [Sneathiella sp.]
MADPLSRELPPYRGGWAQDFLVSLVFLTRLPVRPAFTFELNALKSACRAFALVGLIVGGLSGTVYIVASFLGVPELIAALLAIAAQVLITGALHEDAIGDVADGFGGGSDKEKKLAIMRDSRVGTYAVVTLVLVIGIKSAAISAVSDTLMGFAIIVTAASISRGVMCWALYFLPAARGDGLGRGAGHPDMIAPLWSTFLIILIAVLILGPQLGAIALFAAICGATLMGLIAWRQIGGQTGDVLGAIQQLSELAVLVTCLAVVG